MSVTSKLNLQLSEVEEPIEGYKKTTVTKNCMIDHLRGHGFSSTDGRQLVENFFNTIKQQVLEEGSQIKLPGFGTFKPAKTAGRKARNFKTGEPIKLPGSTKIKFKPSQN